MVQIKGFDISMYQGRVDFGKAKADGNEFVIIKATQGTKYSRTDYFNNNAPLASGAGLHVGAYHFADFKNVATAHDEASYFLSVVGSHKIDYPLVCDIETNPHKLGKAELTDALIAFLEDIEKAGYFAMYYTDESFLNDNLDSSRLSRFACWGAMALKGSIWQYSQNGQVPGINAPVDLDYAYEDFASIIENLNKPKVPIQKVEAAQSKPEYYIVKAGDNLTIISQKYSTTVASLMKANKIENPDLIYVGQKLLV